MEIFDGHRALFRPLVAPAVALGNFDGVHRGHQRLLADTVAAARAAGGDAVALTFHPHPAQVLAPRLAPRLITSRERKLELIAEAGIDVCIVEPFDRELAALAPDDFLARVVVGAVGARHVVVGYDFSYGAKRAGTPETLARFGADHGFTTEVVAAVRVDGILASSTKTRNFIAAGNLEGARLLLGRDFDIDGTVQRGAGRGRTIGIPTANIAVPIDGGAAWPPGGVYAVRVRDLDASGAVVDGVANLGTKPTFEDDGELLLEIHLLDFAGDLFGHRLRVGFVERLRGERRFSGVDALVAQIRRDIERARALLAAPAPTAAAETE
jgi:riboflavin kinase/FMN adenylyltransferase